MTVFDARLVPAAASAWLVCGAAVAGGVVVGTAAVCVCLLVAIATAVVVVQQRSGGPGAAGSRPIGIRTVAGAVLAACAVAAAVGAGAVLRQTAVSGHPLADVVGEDVRTVVRVTDDPKPVGAQGRWLSIKVDDGRAALTLFAAPGGWGRVLPGQWLKVKGTVVPQLRSDLTAATIRVRGDPDPVGEPPLVQRSAGRIRAALADTATLAVPPDEAALLAGMVLGDVSGISPALSAELRAAGLTHLTAVSGANFAILCGAVLLLLQAMGLPRPVTIALTAFAVVAFVVLVRPSPSVVRAAISGAIGLWALARGRPGTALSTLCAAVLLALLYRPAFAVDLGFALSVAATAGLILLAPPIGAWLEERGVPRLLALAVAIAFAAQLVTAPLVALLSGRLSLVAVVANLLVAPVVAPITLIGMAATLLAPFMPTVSVALLRAAWPELWWLRAVAGAAARVPFGSIPLPDGGAGFVLVSGVTVAVCIAWRWWRRRMLVTAIR